METDRYRSGFRGGMHGWTAERQDTGVRQAPA